MKPPASNPQHMRDPVAMGGEKPLGAGRRQRSGGNRAFERFLRRAHDSLSRRYGAAMAEAVISAAREEYQRLRPRVPYIGGARNVFQPVMVINGWLGSLHCAMRAHGLGAEDTVRVSQEVFDAWLRLLPGFVLRAIGRLAFSAPSRWYFERQARRSQRRRYAEDFVWHVERGPDAELALVFDECAVNKWYDAEGLGDLKPYCNFADVTYSRLMGMGVDATHTIGLGCDKCALRFKHGRATVIPESLKGVIASGSGDVDEDHAVYPGEGESNE
jgi:L-2-amino-thiazoline-4-carboxylic acid hydrolase